MTFRSRTPAEVMVLAVVEASMPMVPAAGKTMSTVESSSKVQKAVETSLIEKTPLEVKST